MRGTIEQGGTLVTAREAHGIFTPGEAGSKGFLLRTLRRALL